MRKGDKISQKIVRHVGTASSAAQLANLQALARIIIAGIEQAEEPQTSLFTPHETAAKQTRDRAALKPCGRCQFEPRSGVSINDLQTLMSEVKANTLHAPSYARL